MDMVQKNGQMDKNMKENGKMANFPVMEFYIILMEIYIKDFGKKIKQTVEEFLYQKMEQNMKGIL